MLVSWKWLSRYVQLEMSDTELADRLSLSGLNHEGTARVGDDTVIDLEVTSNRGDCLGHLGVAREISVLYDISVEKPSPVPSENGQPIANAIEVKNSFPESCSRYTARLIRNVKVGPSPPWLVELLESVGLKSVNNVVDATNYVMLECGQPLHAFDLDKLQGAQIQVRPAKPDESIEAIDHRTYKLDPWMCVIADAEKAVAVAGVMGGASSEVTEATTNLLIEAAIFSPLSVRRTARRLKLHSPSSFRFERRVDPAGVDWASRRASELIVQLGGGAVAPGVIDTDSVVSPRQPIVLRLSQLQRILGIEIDSGEVSRILTKLGCKKEKCEATTATWRPPSWRHDLTREADLIEEVARIHGYDKIPEDSPVPVTPSARRPFDTAMDSVRHLLTAAGVSEAMTPSVVTETLDEMLSPWTDRDALSTDASMLEGAKRLRRSLLPSLLQCRAGNWAASGLHAELFEIAHTYLPGRSKADLPEEQYSIAWVSGHDFFRTKGIVETLLQRLGVGVACEVHVEPIKGFDSQLSIRLALGDQLLGFVGQLNEEIRASLKLPTTVTMAELSVPVLLEQSELVPQFSPISPFPSIDRDLNFVVDESIRWTVMEEVVRSAVGEELTEVRYRETYRDPAKDGEDRKRILLNVELQKADATLTGGEADRLVAKIIRDCEQKLG
ncbi:MAG: phenylalanine--tRNA ligase subunit beta, partial [Pirellulaceae bacterium]